MKKNISDEKLNEMLKTLYNSEVSESFEFKSGIIPDKEELSPQIIVSGSEKHIKKKFIPAKIASIAAAAFLIVNIGINSIDDNNNSFSAPTTQIADIPVESCETSLFDEYLKEFEYEINNFNYQCIKVTANAEPHSNEESDNYIYGELCHDTNIIPAYENCDFIDSDNGSNQSLAINNDEDFYLYIKVIIVPISEDEATTFYTRQSYLVWKDENGRITKIKPSTEKVTAEDIENKIDCNYYYNTDEFMQKLIGDFSDESNDVYIDDILVRPAVAEENRNGIPEVSIIYNYCAYVKINGQLTPVSAQTLFYNSKSGMEFNDNYKLTEKIPFFYSNINSDDDTVSIRKTFFWSGSADEPVDISSYIAELNNNYWLETAEISDEYITENTDTDITELYNNYWLGNTDTESEYEIDNEVPADIYGEEVYEYDLDFCFTDLANMDTTTADEFIEKFGDALQRTENGYTLCSYCLEQNGFDLANIEIYPETYFYEILANQSDNHVINITESNYILNIHFANMSENLSDEEKAENEKFHNRPWAELILK